MEKKLVFISGGARSGKTSFAEANAERIAYSNNRPLYYLATSQKEDGEMVRRIERHQQDRKESDAKWRTIERPLNIGGIANDFGGHEVLLVDCITLLLTNELFQGDFDEELFTDLTYQIKVKQRIIEGILKLSKQVHSLFIVSNEVLYDPIDTENKVVWVYQKLLGEIHQELVAQADEAYLIEAGIPIKKK